MSLGLKQSDAEVFICLAEEGPRKAREISESLKTQEHFVYRSLRNLRNRKIVNASPEHPAEFSAIPFEKALEALLKARYEETQNIEQERDKILSQWRLQLHFPLSGRHGSNNSVSIG